MKRVSVAVTVLALFAACTDERGPTSARPPAISAEISDAAHGVDGNSHFFWLPPMVANPTTFHGPFNPRLSPVVQICDQRATSCKGHEHALFTHSSGPGGATVGVDVAGQKYMVNWNTSPITEPVGSTFRIAVLLHDQVLGFADVDIVATGKAKNAITGEDIALVDGRTLPIKFRIEENAFAESCTAASPPLDCAEGTAPPTATTTIITAGDGAGNQAGTLIPTGALSQTVTVTIRRNLARPCIPPPFDLPQYQGCYDLFTDPGPNTFNTGPGIDPVIVGICIEVELTRSAGEHAHIAQFDAGQPVRILPQVAAGFLNCDASDPYHPGEGTTGSRTPRGSNLLGLARNGLDLLRRYLMPRPLVAAHLGVGGTPPGYSTFTWTLPVIVSKDPASDGQTAAAGTPVAINPSVIATDSGGARAEGVIVHFHAVDGSVAKTVDTTGVDGIASPGTWTLGSSAGPQTLVATSTGADGSPLLFTANAITPPAGQIAFTRTVNPNVTPEDDDIFLVNVDGTGVINLTNNAALDAEPRWSPDGAKIAFQSRRNDVGDVFVMNADGSNPVDLTNNPDAFEITPVWSPDGTKIAYMNRTPFDQIFVMNADGSNNTLIAGTAAANAGFPSWSPDGTKIAFVTNRDGNAEIYVMNADGSNPVNLTQHPGFDFTPVWSPDGTKIAWFTTRDGNGEIYVMNVDGSNPVNVTHNPASDLLGDWSPDGRFLVFSSDRDGNSEIYITTVTGSFVQRVTSNAAKDFDPAWRP